MSEQILHHQDDFGHSEQSLEIIEIYHIAAFHSQFFTRYISSLHHPTNVNPTDHPIPQQLPSTFFFDLRAHSATKFQ
jgi:hypothetical protein